MTNIAILGLGVVGMGTADLLEKNKNLISGRLGDEIHIKYILDLRDFPDTPYADRIVHDFECIRRDPEIKLVAEMMGGAHPAYDFTKACLEAGKSVVTSNKEVVATFGAELLATARKYGVTYAFEASVGGGIPIIRPLCKDFVSNEISAISGILNGTTNYILTEMLEKSKSYGDALAEAQEKGFAEKDPTADVDGIDTCRKICILTAMATGILPDANHVKTVGIRNIDEKDVKLLAHTGASVKLLGRMTVSDGKPCCIVAPFAVFAQNPLAHVSGVFNGIIVHGETLGDTMFYGRGAGAEPTASAVCNDIVSILRDGVDSFAPVFTPADQNSIHASEAFCCRRYIRTDNDVSEVIRRFGPVQILDGAFITDRAFSEKEFDVLTADFEPKSTLRVF